MVRLYSFFLTLTLLMSFIYTAERNVQGRTGSGTRLPLNPRTMGAVQPRLRSGLFSVTKFCTFRFLLLVSFASCGFCAVYVRVLPLLYILVPYVCDVSRLASVCCYAVPMYAFAFSVGPFPFQPVYCISLSTVYVLFGICQRQSYYGCVVQ